MNIVNADGKEYDLDAVPREARAHIEQLMFLSSNLAKKLVPAAELPGQLETTRKALAQALPAE